MPKRLTINDTWVLEREGSFSTNFSSFLNNITGGLKLTDTIKAGLDVARTMTDFGDTGFVKPLLDKIWGTLGVDIKPELREKLQKKLDQRQKEAQRKIDEAQKKTQKRIEETVATKEIKIRVLEDRIAQHEADLEAMETTVGQQVASQLFSTKMDSLVAALYSVAKERGITNEEILNIIKALPEFEALLYIMNVRKFYRDHTAHSLRVAALGDFLLDKEGFAGGLEELIKEKLNFTKEEVRTTWWFTGLLHDIGTPLAKLFSSLNWSMINEMTRCYSSLGMEFSPLEINVNHPELGNTDYLQILCEGYPQSWQKIITSGLGVTIHTPDTFRYSAQSKKHAEYKPTSTRIDHGVVAAVALLRTLGPPDQVSKDQPENHPLIEAARVIALHDNIEKLGPLRFEEYPLLFLLAICDELQEWGRPIPVSSEEGYFTTSLQKVTLTDAIFHETSLELWDIPFTNAQAKSLMGFDFDRLHNDKETKLRGLDCTEQFPETDLLLIDYDKDASKIEDKYEIKIKSL
ncbi:MAG: OmpH family outer membrane protein [Promethearchaeota archaeon]